jgi:lipopolysaccharide cholinephosphotransferase
MNWIPVQKKLKTSFPADFFKEETRNGWFVTEKMKKIWAVEIDLYREFARVCDEYGLKYYMIYGGLLGAVRHGGFIPWDDDLDVCMPREDYDKLCALPERTFQYPYSLQTPFNQTNYSYTYIRLVNNETLVYFIRLATVVFIQESSLIFYVLTNANRIL